MRVLLVNPSDTMTEIMGGMRVFVHKTEPLGLLYIAAVLERAGHTVAVIDAWARELDFEQVKSQIASKGWDVIGINTLTSSGKWVYEMGRHLKATCPDTRVVLGNVHASVYASFYLDQGCADVICHGESELIMEELCAAFEAGRPLSAICGISYLEGNEVKSTGPGRAPDDLDSLPLPARHLVDMDLYSGRDFVTESDGGTFRVMIASRGCTYECTFCAMNAHRNHRVRSPSAVAGELKLLVERYGAAFVELLDPLFTVNKQWVIEVCKAIIDSGVEVEWLCEGHVNTVDDEMLSWMKRAGCRILAFGLETATAETLKRVRKGSSPEGAYSAVEATAKAGISPHGLFVLGFPGETRAQAEDTIRLSLSLPIDFAQYALLVPYPGSEIYYSLVKQGLLDNEADPAQKIESWQRYSAYLSYTDQEPIFVADGWTAEQLKATQRSAIRRFYLRPRQIAKEIRKFRLRNWRLYLRGVSTVFRPWRRSTAPSR